MVLAQRLSARTPKCSSSHHLQHPGLQTKGSSPPLKPQPNSRPSFKKTGFQAGFFFFGSTPPLAQILEAAPMVAPVIKATILVLPITEIRHNSLRFSFSHNLQQEAEKTLAKLES
jgi:hypothetical protein